MFLNRLFFALCLALPLAPATAHEFWISPDAYQVAPGGAITANFRNGEIFEGGALSYFDRTSARYDTIFDGPVTPVDARAGDRPALQMKAPDQDGLLSVVHETQPSKITYREWEKFAKFAAHKDFPGVEAAHIAAGWPKEGFREAYTRHAKTLIAVGSGAGQDQAVGLATEFVALTNPYAADFGGEMKVLLLYQGAPRADAQVEVFDRQPGGLVLISLYRTNDKGEVTIPVMAGHEYLFDAVVLRPSPEAGTSEGAPVWETLWAALTFAVPE